MTNKEERYILRRIRDMPDSDTIATLIKEVHQNNLILRQNNKMLAYIVKVLNQYLQNANNENIQDFGRNVLANLISNFGRIG